jgi:hypothetical protein
MFQDMAMQNINFSYLYCLGTLVIFQYPEHLAWQEKLNMFKQKNYLVFINMVSGDTLAELLVMHDLRLSWHVNLHAISKVPTFFH